MNEFKEFWNRIWNRDHNSWLLISLRSGIRNNAHLVFFEVSKFLSKNKRNMICQAVYTDYCLLQERSLHVLEKYEADPNTHKILQNGKFLNVEIFQVSKVLIDDVNYHSKSEI